MVAEAHTCRPTDGCCAPALQHKGDAAYSACAQQGVAVKPRAGDAVLFYSQTPDNVLDPLSAHSGCPVIRGEKWSATKWLRQQPYL
jgi:2OG-Fe(II) oxygenase superfamily